MATIKERLRNMAVKTLNNQEETIENTANSNHIGSIPPLPSFDTNNPPTVLSPGQSLLSFNSSGPLERCISNPLMRQLSDISISSQGGGAHFVPFGRNHESISKPQTQQSTFVKSKVTQRQTHKDIALRTIEDTPNIDIDAQTASSDSPIPIQNQTQKSDKSQSPQLKVEAQKFVPNSNQYTSPRSNTAMDTLLSQQLVRVQPLSAVPVMATQYRPLYSAAVHTPTAVSAHTYANMSNSSLIAEYGSSRAMSPMPNSSVMHNTPSNAMPSMHNMANNSQTMHSMSYSPRTNQYMSPRTNTPRTNWSTSTRNNYISPRNNNNNFSRKNNNFSGNNNNFSRNNNMNSVRTNAGATVGNTVQGSRPNYNDLTMKYWKLLNKNDIQFQVQADGDLVSDVLAKLQNEAEDMSEMDSDFEETESVENNALGNGMDLERAAKKKLVITISSINPNDSFVDLKTVGSPKMTVGNGKYSEGKREFVQPLQVQSKDGMQEVIEDSDEKDEDL